VNDEFDDQLTSPCPCLRAWSPWQQHCSEMSVIWIRPICCYWCL